MTEVRLCHFANEELRPTRSLVKLVAQSLIAKFQILLSNSKACILFTCILTAPTLSLSLSLSLLRMPCLYTFMDGNDVGMVE